MENRRENLSRELANAELMINSQIMNGRYQDAVEIMRKYSDAFDFEITLSDQPAECLRPYLDPKA
jgi:hypothetical protein